VKSLVAVTVLLIYFGPLLPDAIVQLGLKSGQLPMWLGAK